MFELSIENSSICNFNCIFCGYNNRTEKGIMPLDLFKECVDQSLECGIQRIKFSPLTGDPFADPNIIQKIDYIKDKMQHFKLYTNLSLASTNQLQDLIDLEMDHMLRITIYGHDLESFLFFTRSKKEYYNNILKNLNFLSQYPEYSEKIYVSIRSPKEYKITNGELFLHLFKVLQYKKGLYYQHYDIDNYMNSAQDELIKEFGFHYHESKTDICTVLDRKHIILNNGDFLLCGCRDIERRSKVGNIKDTKLIDLIKLKKQFLRDDKEYICRDCMGIKQ